MDETAPPTNVVPSPKPAESVGVTAALPAPTPVSAAKPALQPRPTQQRNRAAQVFAIISIVIAAVAAGLYLFTRTDAPPRLTPEETVREFLSSVFLAEDPQRVAGVVCSNWDPVDAIERTQSAVTAGAHVSWDQLVIVTTGEERSSATARLGFRRADDRQPSAYVQWRFSMINEDGWRVCEARPAT